MMEYKRLKEKLETILTLPELPFEEDLTAVDCKIMYDILCKIERGKMIELPCKVGDTIYWTSSNNRDIIEVVVEKISFTKYDRVILLVEEKGVGEYSIPLVWDIFLAREEAEKRLKELQE